MKNFGKDKSDNQIKVQNSECSTAWALGLGFKS